MSSQFPSLLSEITPRARLGLAVLGIIGVFLLFDWGERIVQDQEFENQALQSKLADLDLLRTDQNLDILMENAQLQWQTYEALLLSDETEGLNVASLQSLIIQTLNDCGLKQVVASIETEPTADDQAWLEYRVSVRARDQNNQFPVCLADLSELETGIIVSDLAWRRGGNIEISLKAYSVALSPGAR